jgi:uncharacterized repeat protein (TIGR03803 family)
MFNINKLCRSCSIVLGVLVALLFASGLANAESYRVLQVFQGKLGKYPSGGLIGDADGSLYGVTSAGGLKGEGCIPHEGQHRCGLVYRYDADGSYTVLYAFQGGADGYAPYAGVLRDAQGNLYGTAFDGGAHNAGNVFKLAPDGTKTVLYSFDPAQDGYGSYGTLVADKKGNLYGAAVYGGAFGEGTIFRIAPDGSEKILYSFCAAQNCADGVRPYAPLLIDNDGNLYGGTSDGGSTDAGTTFRLSTDGIYTVLHDFGTVKDDGDDPVGGLIADAAGNLYGTTNVGGSHNYGTVFKIAPDLTETILHHFSGKEDGAYPTSTLMLDADGNLFGAAYGFAGALGGTLFKIATDGSFHILHTFEALARDGFSPNSNLVQIGDRLYGTTTFGGRLKCGAPNGHGCGVLFSLRKN